MFDSVPSDAVGYVASAYLFFLLMVLVYIAILGAKFQRVSRELGELIDEIESDRKGEAPVDGDDRGGTDGGPGGAGTGPADSRFREESSV